MLYPKEHQKKILFLLEKDQRNIRLYKKGEIDFNKMKKESGGISCEFMAIISDNGFPFRNTTTNDVYTAAIVLSLHLPIYNLKQIFKKIKNVSKDMLDPMHLAYFTDKILIHSGRKQKYGTQYKTTSKGNVEILPIVDYPDVDTRRAKVGLEKLSEYKKKIK